MADPTNQKFSNLNVGDVEVLVVLGKLKVMMQELDGIVGKHWCLKGRRIENAYFAINKIAFQAINTSARGIFKGEFKYKVRHRIV